MTDHYERIPMMTRIFPVLWPATLASFTMTFFAMDAIAQVRAPKSERFKVITIANTEQLAKYISPEAFQVATKLIQERKCPHSNMKLFQNRKPNRKTKVLTVPCDPTINSNRVGGRYFEYPLTIVIQGSAVAEADLPHYGFIYDTGRLKFITDTDGNDMPEFWLSGEVCEPGPDDPELGNCNGSAIVEFRNGSLHLWKTDNQPSSWYSR